MIAIIGAMDEEVSALLKYYPNALPQERKGVTYYENDEIIIAKSGVGKVDAAYTTAFLLNNFKIDFVINIGSAGGLQTNQQVGDIVIADKLSYHDFILDSSAEHLGGLRHTYAPASIDLNLTKEILDELNLRYHVGWGVSGDQFITTSAQVSFLKEHFPLALFCEMEATAIAQVCTRFQTPFIILRSLSDIAVLDGNDIAFNEYLIHASEQSAQIASEFIRRRGV